MRWLVIGGLGSIGRRYVAILKDKKEHVAIADPLLLNSCDLDRHEFDIAIVASPTDTHVSWCKSLMQREKIVLCEKPLSKIPSECKEIEDYERGYVVNNYYQACKMIHEREPFKLFYNYYNTGRYEPGLSSEEVREKIAFDCCQLIALDKTVRIQTDSPVFRFWVNQQPVTLSTIESSYVRMISYLLDGKKSYLWDWKKGRQMTEDVYEYLDRNSGKNGQR